MFWNEWIINFPNFCFWDMVDFGSYRYTLKRIFFIVPKDAQCSDMGFWFFFVAIFGFWFMVDFVFYLGSAFRTLRIQKKMYVGLAPPLIFVGGFAPKPPNRGSTPQSTDAFRLNRPSQLVLGVYPWLAFLNQVHRPSSLRMLNTKSTISQKLNIAQKNSLT